MGRAVLVTGASSGIGLETVLHLSGVGFRVVGTVRTAAKADGLREAARSAGVEVEPLVLDLVDNAAGVDAVVALEPWAVVNNAGYANLGLLEDVSADAARRQLEAMVVGPMRLALAALPAMRRQGEGRIVNVSSIAARVAGPMLGWYQASKHALSALSEALRVEVGSSGVHVVLVEPGVIRTAIWGKVLDDVAARREGSLRPRAYDRVARVVRALEPHMHEPRAVAGAIGAALTADRPKWRYRVGAEVPLLRSLDGLVPRRAQDAALRALLRL